MNCKRKLHCRATIGLWCAESFSRKTLPSPMGPIFKKILGKTRIFPKFMLSLLKVIKLRFSQNIKFNSLLQY